MSPSNAPVPKPGLRQRISGLNGPSSKQQASYQPVPEAVQFCQQTSAEVEQAVKSIPQLAATPPHPRICATSAGQTTGLVLPGTQAVRPLLVQSVNPGSQDIVSHLQLQSQKITTSEAAVKQSALSLVLDDIQSELRSCSHALEPSEANNRVAVDPPKACRSHQHVLPHNVKQKPDHPVAQLPPLPRSVRIRPQLEAFATPSDPTGERPS